VLPLHCQGLWKLRLPFGGPLPTAYREVGVWALEFYVLLFPVVHAEARLYRPLRDRLPYRVLVFSSAGTTPLPLALITRAFRTHVRY
jgi:hypothetical protein